MTKIWGRKMKLADKHLQEKTIINKVFCQDELMRLTKEIALMDRQCSKIKNQRSLQQFVKKNDRFLHKAYQLVMSYVHEHQDMVPAAEWFLDNFYLLKNLKHEIKQNFSGKYERRLTCLSGERHHGYPRIYSLMRELVEHTDYRIQESVLREFLSSYQQIEPLDSAELWAVPIMLKILLQEKVRALTEEIIATQDERKAADEWLMPFEHLAPDQWEKHLAILPRPMILSSTFTERVSKKVKEYGQEKIVINRWLEKTVKIQETTIEALIKHEHQFQSNCQVSMGNAISGLRFLMEVDWPRLFEEINVVHQILLKDPSKIFEAQDFNSRDYYRHQVEKLAQKLHVSEFIIAQKAVELCNKTTGNDRTLHIGHYLLGEGIHDLIHEIRAGQGRKSKNISPNRNYWAYFGSIGLVSALLESLWLLYALYQNAGLSTLIIIGLILLIPISSMAMIVTNCLITQVIKPTFLPKLEFSEGIPEDLRTVVVIPTLYNSVNKVKELAESLEVYFLANQDPNLFFAVLGDFTDSVQEHLPDDEELIMGAKEEIRKLNQKYGVSRFFLLHRHRRWNESERVWMGWERKRGKLLEFNRFLLEGELGGYTFHEGNIQELVGAKYVITLDCDTLLPRDGAARLIGTMAHPMQTPVLNSKKTRVVSGYGILQPRIGISVPSARATLFAKIFAGKVGIDPYTFAVSDVYQDVFGEGIFTGKGIYDVRVFHQVTADTFPENRILSHDLIEGIYVRAGLVTDIQLMDGFPEKYQAHLRRLHRWVRGDWQLISWLKQPLPRLSKWKIIDNLRRSLEAPAQFVLLLFALFFLPGNPWVWNSIILIGIFLPVTLHGLERLWKRDEPIRDLGENLLQGIIKAWCTLSFLPFQAVVMLDAILKSLTRQWITHHHLLEWETAEATEKRLANSLAASWRTMGMTVGAVWLLTMLFAWINPQKVGAILPFAVIWTSAPWLSYRISRPLHEQKETLDSEMQEELRLYARRIWAFFEDHVTERENWLPPDNIQIEPPKDVAYRTSPTNIGLAMLGNLAAWDFGYLTSFQAVERIENSLYTIEQLKRWRGHLFNWYDILSLEPLNPMYVSTVDSGNLAVYLLTLREGLNDLIQQPDIGLRQVKGLQDTCRLVQKNAEKEQFESLLPFLNRLENFSAAYPENTSGDGRSAQMKPAGNWAKKDVGILNAWEQLFAAWPDRLPELEGEGHYWLERLDKMLRKFRKEVAADHPEDLPDLYQRIAKLQVRLEGFALSMEFKPLYDERRQLFSVGYRVAEGTLDKSYYDLLASEARQAGFFAIAKGEIPQAHWFHLGRGLTKNYRKWSLVSWSGTMFEFLMPLLVMRNYSGTILDETNHSIVAVQSAYGKYKKIPWGISESGYYAFDPQMNYQYKAFGVPGLGLKRGLADELVIAPYASFLALQVSPVAALENIRHIGALGCLGRYGLFEAVDYTKSRLKAGQSYRIVQSYMAHHQGMSLLAMTNLLNQNCFQERFHAHPIVQATELLLQERIPAKTTVFMPPEEEGPSVNKQQNRLEEDQEVLSCVQPVTAVPVTHFVGNGSYAVMMANSGAGFSRFQEMMISRWHADVTRENWGMYFYIQNLNAGNLWSATYQPLLYAGDEYQVTATPDKIEYQRKDGNIHTRTTVVVSPEDPVEIRRISLSNYSQHSRTLEITSYFEVVLAPLQDDLAHPAFSNLFIQTEFANNALFATRRTRSPEQKQTWLMHVVNVEGVFAGTLQYETDRARFIGRGRNLQHPLALEPNQPLSNTVGAVLDPMMSLRQRVLIKPGQTVHLSFVVGVAESKERAIYLAGKYQEYSAVQRAIELAWTYSQMELRHLGLSPRFVNTALSLGGQILYPGPARRKQADSIIKNDKGQSGLWAYGISGDHPIVLLRVSHMDHIGLVRNLLNVHDYWQLKGLSTDLVILNEDESGYRQNLQDMLQDLAGMQNALQRENGGGKVQILQKKFVSDQDFVLLQTVARLIFCGEEGSFLSQVRNLHADVGETPKPLNRVQQNDQKQSPEQISAENHFNSKITKEGLIYCNSFGGFTADGKEYVIDVHGSAQTPLPWINVIANRQFGCLISASGAGYTWSGNSRENKLTTWSNDPVLDPPSEVIYLQEEERGYCWTVTPDPIRKNENYRIRHGQGYTVFEQISNAIKQELTVFVPLHGKARIAWLSLTNQTQNVRNLTVTYYAELVMGPYREVTSPYIVTEYDPHLQCLLAYNAYREEFSGRIVYLHAVGKEPSSYTGDRTEFIGRNLGLEQPEGLRKHGLSNRVGAGYDPCLTLKTQVTLEAGASRDIMFIFGESESWEDLAEDIQRYKDSTCNKKELSEIKNYWQDLLGGFQVETPDRSFDILVNYWLLYQTVVCRLWARSAFYQSGGAIGFRDQLQDVMALTISKPQWTREQILLHCAHQFKEGDVLHWWHQEENKGIRTKFSDDLLWLPYVTLDYLEHTEDFSILDETVPFLEGELLGNEEDECYARFEASAESGSVHEHCVRAIERGLRLGKHGLPLIGTGDWNDGFSRVGRLGQGESVWLGWFLIIILERYALICQRLGEVERQEHYLTESARLRENMDIAGWDGGWYRRAYFDDGTPIGSAGNKESQIDAIAQVWAVLAGASRKSRIQDAMLALENYLWRKEERLLLLLTPPFDQSEPNPGYIRGYVPGVRENGGQYTHAGAWTVLAYTGIGQGDKALELFQMLNPIQHTQTESEVMRYKAEPYVMAADVYANYQHSGRGGWTWYTGSAGWMYQAAVEGILGFRLHGDQLSISPCIASWWQGYKICYRYKSSLYRIQVENPFGKMTGVQTLHVDGDLIDGNCIRLKDDGQEHQVSVIM